MSLHLDLDKIWLVPGFHTPNNTNMCVMEAVALHSGLEWTDDPETVNKDVARLARAINDWLLNDKDRQNLKQLIPRLALTGSVHSTEVMAKVDTYFHWDAEQEAFAFRIPEDPITVLDNLIDQLTFQRDMQEQADKILA